VRWAPGATGRAVESAVTRAGVAQRAVRSAHRVAAVFEGSSIMGERDPRLGQRPASHGANRIRAHLAAAPRLSDVRELRLADVLPARGARAGVALVQGVWDVALGAWPLLDPRSYQELTGAKQDVWLARSVGMLLALVGASLLFARARRSIGAETMFLAIASALALAFADVLVATSGAGTNAYLIDAALQLVFAGVWALGRGGDRRRLRVVTWNPAAPGARPRAGGSGGTEARWR